MIGITHCPCCARPISVPEHRPHAQWSPQCIAFIEHLRRHNVSGKMIAAMFGVSRDAINQVLSVRRAAERKRRKAA